MRFYSALALSLLLTACATRPQQQAPEPVPAPAPTPTRPAEQGQLIGKTAADLIGYFGSPALRIQEGVSVKLQFRAPECVLDAYLYPGSGGMRVTHVDTRYPSGTDMNQAACIVVLADAKGSAPS